MARGAPKSSRMPALPATISMLAARRATRSPFSSLRFRLLLAILVPFVAAAAWILYETLDRRAYGVRHSGDQVVQLLNSAEARERQALDHAHQLLLTLSHLSAVRRLDVPECNALFAEIVAESPRYANISLIGPGGDALASGVPMPEPLEVRSRVWYQRAVKTRRVAIGDYLVGRVTKRPSIHLAQPMIAPKTEEITAVLMAAIDLEYLAGVLPKNLPAGSAAYVLDSEGTILAQGGGGAEARPGAPFPHMNLLSGGRVSESNGPAGPWLVGDREIRIGDGEHPVRIVLTVPTAAVLRNSNAMVNRAIAALAVLAILSLGAWLLGDRFIVRRTRALVRVTRDLGSGKLDARAATPYDRGELGELERAFNAMADSLQRREVAVLESEGRFREIAETVQEAFWVASPDGRRVIYLSPAFEQIWGRPVSWVEGRFERILETVDPADRERFEAAAAKMAGGGFQEECRILRPDGETRLIFSRAFTVLDSEARVARIVGFTEDITERKRIEDQFLQSQKMEALGRLAGGVAHDFNNLLTVISGYADILMSESKLDEDARHHLQEIMASSRRASSLTRQLLAFSRKQIVQRQAVDLNENIRRMEDMLRRLIGENIKLAVDRADDLGIVMADPGHIEQTIMNLVVNARDAMPRGGTMRIETANVELDEAYARDHAGVTPGPYVMLAVSDTGVGMDAATRARLFEPFFTTKERGKGTGLGLATVYGIAKQSGGHIWVYSEPGRGSTFKIYFPRASSDQKAAEPRAPAGAAREGSETILVVEDDVNRRGLVRGALQSLGYAILEAGDGAEAERVSVGFQGRIHLLLTDSVLPTLSGPALSRALAEKRPDLKVLFMSGYTDASVFEQAGVEIGRAFLQKPFTIEAMARKVREVLDA